MLSKTLLKVRQRRFTPLVEEYADWLGRAFPAVEPDVETFHRGAADCAV
jgi:hypothetical protein